MFNVDDYKTGVIAKSGTVFRCSEVGDWWTDGSNKDVWECIEKDTHKVTTKWKKIRGKGVK